MKKFSIYIGIIVLLFASLYFLDQWSNKAELEAELKQNEAITTDAQRLYKTTPENLMASTRSQLKDENYQNIILPDELEQRLNNKESLFVYFFSPECIYCAHTTPKLTPIATETETDMKQYNVLEFNQGWSDYNIESTPTLIYFKDGKEEDRITGGIVEGGEQSEATYRAFMQKHK